MPVLADLLPPGCRAHEARADVPVDLFPQERADVERAVPRRRAEYATVRHCARLGLADLGLASTALPRGHRGAPVWPVAVVGSLTHCAGYRAAVVARSTDLRGIGIDAEPHSVLPGDVLGMVARETEREHLAELTGTDRSVRWDRLLFCAKEAVYKVWSPLTGRWLGFEDAELRLERAPRPPRGGSPSGTFTARLLVPGPVIDGRPLQVLTGRWAVDDGILLTATWLPRAPVERRS